MATLVLNRVTKRYPNGCVANCELSLEAEKGEIVGVIGPNGAGKTTLVRQVLGLLPPTDGSITVLGHEMPWEADRVRGRLGYVPQMPMRYPALTPHELVTSIIRMKGVRRQRANTRATEILSQVGIQDVCNRYAYQLSYGTLKLMNIAMALCQDPELLILDEPTSMIDVVNRVRVRKLLARQPDRCILLTSHDLAEVRNLCNRSVLLVAGRIIARGSPRELASLMGSPARLEVTPCDPNALRAALARIDCTLRWDGAKCKFVMHVLSDVVEILTLIDEQAVACESITLEAPSLEEGILRLLEDAE